MKIIWTLAGRNSVCSASDRRAAPEIAENQGLIRETNFLRALRKVEELRAVLELTGNHASSWAGAMRRPA